MKIGAPDFPRHPVADKFLYQALVRINDYKYAKLLLFNSISFGDMRGSQNENRSS